MSAGEQPTRGKWACIVIATALPLLMPLVVAPTRAPAADIGISEPEPAAIDNPYFRELVARHKPKLIRGIFPWDVAKLRPDEFYRVWLDEWLKAVRAVKARPLVTLNVGGGPKGGPSRGEYAAAFRAFIDAYGNQVTEIAPWNEPNRSTIEVGSRKAADYFKIARSICTTCTLAAGEFAGNPRSLGYIRRYMRALGDTPAIIGIHTHGDVKRFELCRASRKALRQQDVHEVFDFKRRCRGSLARLTRFFIRHIPNRELWITEVRSFKRLAIERKTKRKRKLKIVYFSEQTQCRATAFIQSLPAIPAARGRITRIYHYRFSDSPGRFKDKPGLSDEGLLKRAGEPTKIVRGRPRLQRKAFFNVKYEDTRCVPRPYATAFTPLTSWQIGHGVGSDTQLMADPTGDGRADAVVFFAQDGSWHVAASTGTAFAPPAQWISGHGAGFDKRTDKTMLDDVNGDDLADAVVFFKKTGSWHVALSRGDSFGPPSQWIEGHGVGADMVTLSDVTGDGLSDAIVHIKDDGSWYVAPSTGTSFAPFSRWISGHGDSGSDEQMMDDVTGDDLPDAVVYEADSGSWRVAASTGTAFAPPSEWATGLGIGSEKQALDDVTGDNLADAIVHYENGGSWHVAHSTGSTFDAPVRWLTGFGLGAATHFVADATGDDRGDAAVFNTDGSWQVVPASP